MLCCSKARNETLYLSKYHKGHLNNNTVKTRTANGLINSPYKEVSNMTREKNVTEDLKGRTIVRISIIIWHFLSKFYTVEPAASTT
jgi:hypothetical protein